MECFQTEILQIIIAMGNASLYLEKYDIVRYFRRHDWVKLSVNHHFQIWRHRYTHQTAEVYRLNDVPTIEDMQIFDFRNKHQQLAKIYFLAFENQTGICGSHSYVQILVEHIPYKLQKLGHLTQHEALTVFITALKGFKVIQEQFGPIQPTEELIGVNIQGKTKVWLNKNPTLNHAQNRQTNTISSKFAQVSIRVRKLYAIIQQKCEDTFLPFSIKQKFCNRNIAYSDAILIVQQYAKSCKISLNQYLNLHHISQKIVTRNNNQRNKIGHNSQSRGIVFQNSFISHGRQYISQKTLKKAASLIHINRGQSNFNKNDSQSQLNYSRVVFKSPQNSQLKVNSRPHSVLEKSFTKISFINNNTPTKVFYSPKASNKSQDFSAFRPKMDQFEDSRKKQDPIQQKNQQNRQRIFDQTTKEKSKVDTVLIQSIQLKNKDYIAEITKVQMPSENQNKNKMIQNQKRTKELLTTFGNQKQTQFFKSKREQIDVTFSNQAAYKAQIKEQAQPPETQKQLFSQINRLPSIIDGIYQKVENGPSISQIQSESNEKIQINLSHQHPSKQRTQAYRQRESNYQGVNSPCFNSQINDTKQVSFAEIQQQKKQSPKHNIEAVISSENIVCQNSPKKGSVESIDSLGNDKRRKRTSIFGALEVDYKHLMQQQVRNDEVKEMDESFEKQPIFGSFSKIGSFNIVKIDSLLQRKYEEMITKEDRENKFKIQIKDEKGIQSTIRQAVPENPSEQDFLNVEYLEKSLDKRYSPHISRRVFEKQPAQEEDDDTLNINKLEEGLLKFSKHIPKLQNQIKQELNFNLQSNQPQVIVVQKINFLQVSPVLKNQAKSSIRYADSDSYRVDNQWEVSDTSINVAILNNREKEREQSLKKTSSSSKFHFYDTYGRNNTPNYYQTNKFYDSKFSKQTKYYNTWETGKRQSMLQSNSDKYRKDYQFEQKYKKHVKLRSEYRPTTSYKSKNEQLLAKYKPRQDSFKYEAGKLSLQGREADKRKMQEEYKQAKQPPTRKLTYDQLRQLLWN